jgi:hypothetical protein
MGAKRHPKSWWRQVVDEFEAGSQSRQDFCERKKLNVGTFEGWLYRVRKERRGMTLVPVVVEQPPRMAMPIELDLPGGRTLRFAAGTDAAYVGALVTEASRRC